MLNISTINNIRSRIALLVLTVIVSISIGAETSIPSERLDSIKPHFQKFIDNGRIIGLTTLVAQHGKIVHFETYGHRDKEKSSETQKDTIYRIYSMTKPITGVAMMMLWEEGKFKLDDPLSKFIPEFADVQVYDSGDTPETIKTKAPTRAITIRDVMTHTAGFTYGIFGNHPVDKAYLKAKLSNDKDDGKTFVQNLAKLPLMYDPGSRWHYSVAVDVQGYLVEKLSGMKFGQFLQSRIFDPLEMTDTSFYLKQDKRDRLSQIYAYNKEKKVVAMEKEWGLSIDSEPTFESGGGGLLSTTEDYWRFSQMMLNNGELNGKRLLKPETVALMIRNHLPKDRPYLSSGSKTPGDQRIGFGLDFAVTVDPSNLKSNVSKGEYYWGGAANTVFWIDPAQDLIAIIMTNILPPRSFQSRDDMRELLYGTKPETSIGAPE